MQNIFQFRQRQYEDLYLSLFVNLISFEWVNDFRHSGHLPEVEPSIWPMREQFASWTQMNQGTKDPIVLF